MREVKEYVIVYLFMYISVFSFGQNIKDGNIEQIEKKIEFELSNQNVPFVVQFHGSCNVLISKEILFLRLSEFNITFNNVELFSHQNFELKWISMSISRKQENEWKSIYSSNSIEFDKIVNVDNPEFVISEELFKIPVKNQEELLGIRITLNLYDKDGSSIHIHSKQVLSE
ncbi:MAG: hypothetical protein V3U92_14845 [Cellulophaga sp.]